MKNYLVVLFTILGLNVVFAQTTVTGNVVDNAQEPLIGASVVLKGTTSGTITDIDGNFSIVINEKTPFTLVVSYIGYKTNEIQISESQSGLKVVLSDESSILDEVVVSASRVEEKIMESPVTIEKLDLQTIKASASPDFFDQMTKLKGVTTAAGSMTFNSINTRGFGGIANTRFVQLVDGIDNSAPLLNFPMGNLIGLSENDIKSVELVPGAASALYGPNAFNGIMLMSSKSPFDYEGLTVSVKGGFTMSSAENNNPFQNESNAYIKDKSQKLRPLYGADLRYAKTFGKFGFKVTGSYFGATDWLANDYKTDIVTGKQYTGDTWTDQAGEEHLGDRPLNFNGVNTYGDENALSTVPLGQLQVLKPETANALIEAVSGSSTFQMLFPDAERAKAFVEKNFQYLPTIDIRRTGLTEEDLLDNRNASSAKGSLSLYYKPKSDIELSYAFRIGSGNSVYQGTERYVLRNFFSFSNKLEATGKNFMVRSYMTQTNAGDSYNLTALGSYANEYMLGTGSGWAAQYLGNFVGTVMVGSRIKGVNPERLAQVYPNIFRVAHIEARNGADALLPDRESPKFQEAIETIRGTLFQHSNPEKGILGGSSFIDHSRLFHTEGTYDFTSLLKDKVSILVGANHRLYSLFTDGTVFNEDPEGTGTNSRIKINEYGGFVQATKKLINERLRLSASIRYDKNENFKGVFSPRVAAVGTLGDKRQHNIRASFQTGFRNPDTQAQYIYFPASTILIGGSRKNAERYGIYEGGAYTAESFQKFRASALAGQPNPELLETFYMDYIKPEKLSNVEVGYKTLVKNLYIDWNAYFNWYKDFIAQSNVVAKNSSSQKGQPIYGVSDFIASGGQSTPAVFRPYYNVKDKVTSWGTALGLSYKLKQGYTFRTNYSYMDFATEKGADKQGVDFNSPSHMVNIGVGNSNVNNSNAGFDVSYRWQSKYFWVSSFGSGMVDAFGSLDISASYTMKKWNTVFRIGGSNLAGPVYRTNIGGPFIGRQIFAGITYDASVLGGKKKNK
ncbi:MAG: carboxypeptidase-like regulatory domain-containing protein [Chitinophagales bacterium]|nr:carboxypeptidase-like regulatory domain-containing protein [Chitinophagales bacterium]